jgi:LysM repeat protein
MKQSIIALLLVFLIPHCLLAQKTATLIYIDQYKDIAVKEMKRTGIPASITLAQGIIESNSGQSNLALNFKNHFGIKCKSDWQGETTYQDDDAKQECFRVYPTAARSFIDHSDFLKNRPNYAPLFELDPVDDSAWAYGLKKAGYATATDYPRKLIKVIADFELSQYNFPELAKEDSLEAANKKTIDKDAIQISKVDSAVVKIEAIRKDTIAKDTAVVVKKVIILTTDSVQLSPVRGISGTVAVVNTSPNTPNAIQPINELKTVPKLDTVQRMDTVSKKTNKNKTNYPSIRFRINDVPVVWAKAGSSYLAIANNERVPLFRLYEYNEIQAADVLTNDQLVFLAPKKKEIPKKVHTLKAEETLYDISQSEAIQLNFLKEYNPKAKDDNLKEGDFLFLFKPFDAPKSTNKFLDAFTPIASSTPKPIAQVKPQIKVAEMAKDSAASKNIPNSKSKLDFIKKLNLFKKNKS